MSGNDLQFDMVMSLGKALGDVKKMQTELREMTKVMRESGNQSTRTQTQVTDAFKKQETAAKAADAAQRKAFRDAGTALARLQGPIGALAAQIGGGAGLAGAFGRLGAAAAVVGMAMKMTNAVSDAAVNRVKSVVAEVERLRNALGAARGELTAQARAGEAQAPTVRKLVAAGGSMSEAQDIAAEYGFGGEEAAQGLTALYSAGVSEDERYRMTHAAALAAAGGVGSFTENTQRLVGNRQLRTAAAQGGFQGDAMSLAMRLDSMASAEASGDKIAAETGFGWQSSNLSQRLERVRGSGFLRNVTQANTYRLGIDAVNRRRVEQGIGVAAAQGDLARATDPEAAALGDLRAEQRRREQDQARLAGAQGTVSATVANAGMLIGGEGSEEQKLRKLARINAEAIAEVLRERPLPVRETAGGRP